LLIKYEDEAKLDLIEIKNHYLKEGGKALALRMIRTIRAEIATLSENPNRAPAYEFAAGVRRLVVAGGIYLVFYRVTNSIEILHIRRAERLPATKKEMG
jgi:plasmid stabilization system protein ParE